MLYHGNNEELHPAHRGFAESIDADILSISSTSPHSVRSFYQELSRAYSIGEYDTIVAEGSRPLYAGLSHKMLYGSNLIYLCADHRLAELWNSSAEINSVYTLFKNLLGTYGKPLVRIISQQGIDGIIAVSDFVAEYLRPITEDKIPLRVAHPYIQPQLYEQLGQIQPDVDRKIALTVGRSTLYKGVDILVDAWADVRQQHPDVELHIVGKNHPKSFADCTGVRVRGYVEDIVEVYGDTGLYIQPSRIDPFPVTVLEALRAGLPAVVTESTGSKSEIEQLDENLITPATPAGLSEAIDWYFSLPSNEKQALSNTAKARGEQFGPQTRKRIFREQFQELMADIRSD